MFYLELKNKRNNNMKNNLFTLKNATVISIVGTVYWCIIQMMIDNGLLTNINDVIKLGWENEYMESQSFSINRMAYLLSIPFEICGFLFFTLFIRKLKLFDCPKVLADTAFFMRCLSLVLPFANFILNFYIVLNFSESITMSPSSWYNTNPTDYFLLFSLRGKMWNMLSLILIVIANLALIVLFISIIKKHKVIGIVGTIFIPIYTICYFTYIPTTIVLYGWIILFATALWEIKENRIKEEAHSTKKVFTISTILCLIYPLVILSLTGKGGNPFSNPLDAYQGYTTDSLLIQKQYEEIMKTVTQRFATDPNATPDLSHPINATQTFTFDENGKITTCWAFEFKAPELGDAKIYNNVLFVIDGTSNYYSYDEMYQMRQDKYLQLSAIMINGIWKPATYYIDHEWKCVGYESCNRYGSKRTEIHYWTEMEEKAKEMGIELSVNELPLIKKVNK